MTPGTLCPATVQLVLQEIDAVSNLASNFVYAGSLPGADDPTDLLVDPVQYANKVADMEQQTAVIDTDLVMLRDATSAIGVGGASSVRRRLTSACQGGRDGIFAG